MSEIKGIVFNIMRYSTEDGPGLRTTVFLKGCPLSCKWCHNPESQKPGPELMFRPRYCIGCGACVEACPSGAASWKNNGLIQNHDLCLHCGECVNVCSTGARQMIGREMTEAQVTTEIMKDLPFYEESGGGVTFGGGEPFYQPDFLTALLKACKEEEIHTAVDTSGAAAREAIQEALPLLDLVLFDLKHMDEVRHLALVGTVPQGILDNLRFLDESGVETVIRMPFIPGLNDGPENLRKLGKLIGSMKNINQLELLPYHRTGVEKYRLLGRGQEVLELKRPEKESLEKAGELLAGLGVNVSIKGQKQ